MNKGDMGRDRQIVGQRPGMTKKVRHKIIEVSQIQRVEGIVQVGHSGGVVGDY